MTKNILIALLFFALISCSNEENKSADATSNPSNQTLYFGGDILTMDGTEPSYTEAVVEQGGVIVFTGDKAEAMAQYDNLTEVDLQGKTMLPGFIDPHSHFMSAIQMVNQVNLASPPVGTATDFNSILDLLEIYQKEHSIEDGEWLVGWGYDPELLTEGRHITKIEIDERFPNHKVMIIHVSMHGAVLNSNALEWANIDDTTETPAGGVIARLDDSNEPAGLLMEMAYIPVFENLPQPSEAELLELMEPAQMMYTSEGYTQAVEGFTHIKDLDFLIKASSQGRTFIDLVTLPGFTEMDDWLDNPEYKFGEYNNNLKIQAAKITLDGSPQAKTALVSSPYLTGGPNGEENWQGESSINQEQLDEITRQLFDRNIPIHIHANGSGAIDMMIETVEKSGITAADDRRTIIIHSQFQRADHLPKYVELGLSPSYFTLHTFYWGDVHIRNIGEEAAYFISPVKAAKEQGIIYSNHSDYNVTPLDPFFILWSAMARESRTGVILGPDQRVDAYTALQGLTTGPAWQIFEENRKGKIAKGMLADFVIIENNPLKQDVSDIRNNDVIETIKEGQTVYTKQ